MTDIASQLISSAYNVLTDSTLSRLPSEVQFQEPIFTRGEEKTFSSIKDLFTMCTICYKLVANLFASCQHFNLSKVSFNLTTPIPPP